MMTVSVVIRDMQLLAAVTDFAAPKRVTIKPKKNTALGSQVSSSLNDCKIVLRFQGKLLD